MNGFLYLHWKHKSSKTQVKAKFTIGKLGKKRYVLRMSTDVNKYHNPNPGRAKLRSQKLSHTQMIGSGVWILQ